MELARRGAIAHPDAFPGATGGHPVDEDRLRHLQARIREVAKVAGFPKPLSRTGGQSFDRPCGTVLLSEMDIVPADAAEEGVWSFLTLVLVPEIGPWRFPDLSEDRLLGKPRNVLRRVWWRAWALGGDLDFAPDGCTPLGEDEFVQIMERPSLGGNPLIATAIRDAIWRAEKPGLKIARSELVRQMTRRLRALRSHLSLEMMTEDQLDEHLELIASESINFLTGESSGEQGFG